MQTRFVSKAAENSASQLVREMSRWHMVARAIYVVAELGVADHCGGEPVSVDDLARKTGSNASALERLMRFVASFGIFEELADGHFRGTERSDVLRENHPQSVRSSILRYDMAWWNAVGDMLYSVKTGESAYPHVNGTTFFEHLAEDPGRQARFDAGMVALSRVDDVAVATGYGYSRFGRIVDVGGGRGGLLAQILSRSPCVTGVLFDQPQVIDNPEMLAEAGVLDRCECIGGNFFESAPVGADCYIVKGVLHDFSDEQCVTILRNCREAMADGGRVLVADRIVPPSADGPHEIMMVDLQMLVLLHGRERRKTEWPPIFERAGLAVVGFHACDAGFTMVEGMIS